MTTILTERGAVELPAGSGIEDQLWLSSQDTEAVSGWAMKPEGLCRGDVCMPVPADQPDGYVRGDLINLAAFWRRMNKPLAHSRDGETWALGEGVEDQAAKLDTLEASDFSLPDLEGNIHSLSDYAGKKVFLATWASW